jgi:hypothetical protein
MARCRNRITSLESNCESSYEWFVSDVYCRLNAGCSVVVISVAAEDHPLIADFSAAIVESRRPFVSGEAGRDVNLVMEQAYAGSRE